MATKIVNLEPITRGDTVIYTLNFYRNGEPLDLTGATIKFTAKENAEDSYANAKIKKSVTGFTTNQCIIKLIPNDTINLTNCILVYDIELTDYAGDKTTYIKGELPVDLDVTNG